MIPPSAGAGRGYPAPVDQLLALGELPARATQWPDYLALGLGLEHVPPLVRMATDTSLPEADDPDCWAPIHAWRALGLLRAADAAAPLTSLFHEEDDWDWVGEELPRVFGMIGASAIPVLSDYLDRRDRGLYPRVSAAAALAEIGKAHHDVRDACAAALAAALRHFTTQDRTLNGFLVGHLLDLNAVDASPLMEQAFAAARVDISIAGDWEDAQLALGLIDERHTPRPNYMEEAGLFVSGAPAAPQPLRDRHAEQRRTNKRRRKLSKASKRRNRRK